MVELRRGTRAKKRGVWGLWKEIDEMLKVKEFAFGIDNLCKKICNENISCRFRKWMDNFLEREADGASSGRSSRRTPTKGCCWRRIPRRCGADASGNLELRRLRDRHPCVSIERRRGSSCFGEYSGNAALTRNMDVRQERRSPECSGVEVRSSHFNVQSSPNCFN